MRTMRNMMAVSFLVGASVLTSLMATPAQAQPAVTQACSNWTQLKQGIWGIVCVGTYNSTTNAWASIVNNSGTRVHAAAYVYMKNETRTHTANSTGFTGTLMLDGNNGWLNANSGQWRWVAPPRWARGCFWVDGLTNWVCFNTPALP